MNIFYCFDKNYNTQAYLSIQSIKDNTKEKLNIFILHNEPKSFSKLLKQLEDSDTNISINKFDNINNIKFPNIENSHISEATYYRLFIGEYLDKKIDEILYVDADTVCLNDFTEIYYENLNNLKESKFIIGARTVGEKTSKNRDIWERLDMDGKYFNAGVMFIDMKKWRIENTQNKLLDKLETLRDRIVYWDQDVLNSFFNGQYMEINKNLNFDTSGDFVDEDVNKIYEDVYFVHYMGSNKPWDILSSLEEKSIFYQNLSIKYFNRYHFVSNFRRKDLINFLKILLGLKFLKANNILLFLISGVKFIFFKKTI